MIPEHLQGNSGGPLLQLIYVSSLSPGDEEQLPAILESAQRHNEKNGLTGMLLYAGGNFMQVLEGEPEHVQSTYDRIAQDPRHRSVELISRMGVAHREFPDWSMGLHRITEADVSRFPQHARWFRFGFDPSAIRAQPGVALELLQIFASGAR